MIKTNKILKIILAIVVLCLSFGIIFASNVVARTPKIDPKDMYTKMPEKSVVYYDNGYKLKDLFTEDSNRTTVEYKQLPKNLINAIIVIEDKTFWKHKGFNFWRIGGAIKDSLVNREQISGTSTITQQLARNLYLQDVKSVRSLARKTAEAYYTREIEKQVSKKSILTAYLNTIYFGYNTYGIQSAAKAYFNKDVSKLDLLECAALAAIPKASGEYALVTRIPRSGETSYEKDKADAQEKRKVLAKTEDFIYLYNGDASKDRRTFILKRMQKEGKISEKQLNTALKQDLSKKIKITTEGDDGSGYFSDMLVEQVTDDLMKEHDYSLEEARKMIYTGGLKIYSTMNKQAQNAVENTFTNGGLFPSVTNMRYDGNDNILNDGGGILLYKYSNLIDNKERFIIRKDEYKKGEDGSITLLKNKKLHFYETKANNTTEYSPTISSMYLTKDGVFYIVDSGTLLIPAQDKQLTKKGNLIISSEFLKNNKKFYETVDGTLRINPEYISMGAKTRQPQAAMVIIDYKTGGVKAMVGGRETTGERLYNRAINPRQPGSAIKPLSVYSTAIQSGKEAADSGQTMSFSPIGKNDKVKAIGDYWTAISGINDKPLIYNGREWPKNWYSKYKGMITLRESIEQSVNVNAVRVYLHLPSGKIIDQLQKFGITTLVTEGDYSDVNPAALALGGMTKGISPLEMASAYGVFPNQGMRREPILYTKVVDKKGKVLLTKKSPETRVLNTSVAFVMQDMLRTTVTRGIGSAAQVPGTATAGKTGTTTDEKDMWFCGFTPQYAAALWVGNDVGLEMTGHSGNIASIWSIVMRQATAGMGGSLPGPSGVVRKNGEYFAAGTQKGIRFDPEKEKEKKKKEEEEKKKKEEEEKKKKEEEKKKKEEEKKKKEQEKKKKDREKKETEVVTPSQTSTPVDEKENDEDKEE